MCQLKKLRANEIKEPLAFSVCKLELRWKAIVLHSSSRHTRFNRGQLWEKRKESDVLRQNKTNHGASAATRVQEGTRICHGQQKDKTKGKKRTSTKQKQTAEKVPRRSFKNARRLVQ